MSKLKPRIFQTAV